jgi:hypothetical protein
MRVGRGSGGLVLAGFLLLPLLATRFVMGWLYNASGASVLIAGLFHATHNATVNPTGLAVAVLDLPQGEVVYVTGGLVVLAAIAVVVATGGRLGRPPEDTAAGKAPPTVASAPRQQPDG